MRALGLIMLAGVLVAGMAGAQTIDPASDLGQFRTFRAEGMKAFEQNDPTGAMTALNKAGAILPDSPSILLLKAQVAMKQRKPAEARAALKDYLTRGYVLDLKRNSDFNAIWDAGLNDLLEGNESPLGKMDVMSSSPDFVITEGLAYAAGSGELYLSGVRSGTIMVLSAAGARDVMTFRPGVAAYALGLRDGTIWATTAASRQTQGYDPKTVISSKVVTIDPVAGQVTKTFSDAAKTRRLGHMLMGRDDLYVTDGEHGEILRLNAYQGELQTLIPEGYMDSPDALAENEGATALMVADFVSGLYHVDLTAGSMTRMLPPADGSLLGISWMARYGNDLVAIQTGFRPYRVLRLHMTDDWSQVKSVEVLLRSDKLLAQPTQGAVVGDTLILVAKSQWDNLDDQGNAIKPEPGDTVIGTIKLAP